MMEIATRKEQKGMVVSVKGRLDAVTAPELEKNLFDLIAQGEYALVLDFQGLEYISSAGLRSILAAAKKLKEKQGTMLFSGLRDAVAAVFKISGFLSIFRTFDSEAAALAEIDR